MNRLRNNFIIRRESPFQAVHGLWMKNHGHGDVKSIEAESMKPPNIVILAGRADAATTWRSLFGKILSRETYTIYDLSKKDLVKGFWKSNVAMLVLDDLKGLELTQKEQIDRYLIDGGNVFSHCSMYTFGSVKSTLDENHHDPGTNRTCIFKSCDRMTRFDCSIRDEVKSLLAEFHSEAVCKTSIDDEAVLILKKFGNGRLAASAIDFHTTLAIHQNNEKIHEKDRDSVLFSLKTVVQALGLKCSDSEENIVNAKMSAGVFFGEQKMVATASRTLKARLEGRHTPRHGCLGLQLINEEDMASGDSLNNNMFHIILPTNIGTTSAFGEGFDYLIYRKALGSKTIGRMLIYADIVTSTQILMESIVPLLPDPHGFMLVAGQQTRGKGRGGNIWLSPAGCMMFSIALKIPSSSFLGQRMPFLQHIAAVAVVRSVRCKKGFEDINVRIKWPNDIYIGESIKIGGLIVSSSYSNGEFIAIIGIGVNVMNKKPTACLNSIIEQHNYQHATGLEYFKTEELLARTVTNIERTLIEFEENGVEKFCEMYYKFWLHGNQKVKLDAENGEEVIVRGLDSNGFLLVENKSDCLISLQPDGNSFDMMQGLIRIKTQN